MEFLPSVSTQSILEEMAVSPRINNNQNGASHVKSWNGNQPERARNLPAKRSLDVPFRKSLSDPTALSRPGLQARPSLMRSALSQVPEHSEEIGQGPWTSEALDLFDFWPPGRPKPC
ncbi:hypothetical protein N7509_011125 [Penicillium cosmopolitanum]|uniref:Uncharacterized protein n=1 Tax=Penicillium cosmopolitanum TaxID=1131564 RepID=A0A9W9VSW6_9EURO|nr:uncharacterized protein N7509_011125 [Penicillium cosmopolitanum]KAJ5388584.1 hypothetical protein N7509_011125 [Penicillium cosmopolitanum]